MTQINLILHYKQGLYFNSEAKYTALVTGVGGGKSFIGAHKLHYMIRKYPKALHFIGANTHSQLTQTTLKTFFGILDEANITYVYNRQPPRQWGYKSRFPDHNGIISFPSGAQVWCKALTNYDLIRGQEIGYAWCDETRDTKWEAIKVILGRMRDKNGPRILDFTTTPNGFDWLYDKFAGDEAFKNSLLIQGSSRDNKANLPDGYIESLVDGYDDKFAKQEIDGEFVALGEGQCYYSFNRKNCISNNAVDDQYSQYIIGMDFNVSPMTAVIGNLNGDNLIWFDEISMNGSNTELMCKEIINRYPDWIRRGIKIYPDATGGSGKTSARGNYRSDHAILKHYFGEQAVHGAKSNPRQRDRVTAVNNKFNKGKMVLNPRMKKTISSLEKTSWMDGSKFEINKKMNCEHWSDALGYPVFRLFPIKDTHISGQASWQAA